MNEQIQQLAQVAEQLTDNELAHLERVHNRLYSFTEGREILMGKFAELIVKETCERIEREYKYAQGEKTQWAMSQDIQILIKEHFGVEL